MVHSKPQYSILLSDWPRCAWLGELDSAEESDEISSEFDFQREVLGENYQEVGRPRYLNNF